MKIETALQKLAGAFAEVSADATERDDSIRRP